MFEVHNLCGFLANAPAQAETLLHSLERAAAGIGLHVNAHKTEYKCFNQRGGISARNGNSQKLVDKFTYLGSSVASIETDIKTRLAWIAIDNLSVIWKSDLTDKMKRSIFQAAVESILMYGCTRCTLINGWRKNLTTTTHECCEQSWTSPGSSTPQSSSSKATYHPWRKLSKLDKPDIQDTAGEVGTHS